MENRRSFIKKSGLFLVSSALSLAAFGSALRKKKSPFENTMVTLYVDTANFNKSDINKYCNFGQTDGSSNEDYTIEVNVGDTITWQGVSTSNQADVVLIHSVRHHHGKKIFDQDEITGDGKNPKISRKALYSTQGAETNKYVLRFVIIKNGKKSEVFQIDPKIEVH